MILGWFIQEEFCNLLFGFNLARTLEKTTKTDIQPLQLRIRMTERIWIHILGMQISSIWVLLLISIGGKIMLPHFKINLSRLITFYYCLHIYIRIYHHIYTFSYTYFTPKAIRLQYHHSHIQDKFTTDDISSKLICMLCKNREQRHKEGKKNQVKGKKGKVSQHFLSCKNKTEQAVMTLDEKMSLMKLYRSRSLTKQILLNHLV